MPKSERKHAVVGMYTGTNVVLSDSPPGYLHVHAVMSEEGGLTPPAYRPATEAGLGPQAAYQWGTNAQLATGTRSALVEHGEVARFGNLGLGSAARGAQAAQDFEGGGEAIMVHGQAGRVTRGISPSRPDVEGAVFPLSDSDSYWTAQVTDFSNASWYDPPESSRDISSRDGLLHTLQHLHGLDPRVSFFTSFTAEFDPALAIRSNGGYASDSLASRDLALFRGRRAAGGHIVSDSAAAGDMKSLAEGNVRSAEAPFGMRIVGPVGIKPVQLFVSPDRGVPFRPARTVRRVAVIGGGMAGVTTALEVAKDPDAHVTIFEARQELLGGTSARTPGRMGLGLHYLGDPETAARYLRATVDFARRYPGCELGEGQPHLTHGRYFVVKDDSGAQAITSDGALAALDGLRQEYHRLCTEDPANEVFGPPENFYRTLPESEFGAVDASKVSLGIESCERLLDFPRFQQDLISRAGSVGNIEVRAGTPVTTIRPRPSDGFIINGEPFDQVANCAWERAGAMAALAELPPQPASTHRLKLLAEVRLPPVLHDAHSAFFCLGPYAMFSNMGDGVGRVTYAPVTNHSHSGELALPPAMAEMLDAPADSAERLAQGRQIIDGVAKFIPAMSEATPLAVHAGIVITPGSNVDIRDPGSDVHRRRESGVSQPRADWVDNKLMKLFYAPGNARLAADGLHEGHRGSLAGLIPRRIGAPATAVEGVRGGSQSQLPLAHA